MTLHHVSPNYAFCLQKRSTAERWGLPDFHPKRCIFSIHEPWNLRKTLTKVWNLYSSQNASYMYNIQIESWNFHYSQNVARWFFQSNFTRKCFFFVFGFSLSLLISAILKWTRIQYVDNNNFFKNECKMMLMATVTAMILMWYPQHPQ